MRLKRVHMTMEVLTQVLVGGLLAFATNLPQDTEVIHAKSIPMEGGWYRLELTVYSSEFDDLPEGADVPYLDGIEGYERRLSIADVLRANGGDWEHFNERRDDD